MSIFVVESQPVEPRSIEPRSVEARSPEARSVQLRSLEPRSRAPQTGRLAEAKAEFPVHRLDTNVPDSPSLDISSRDTHSPGTPSIEPTPAWVEVLVDCPGTQGLFTYRIPTDLTVQPGDILSVPFGSQQIGAIAIRLQTQPPHELNPAQIRDVEAVISAGFFPVTYWQLLNQVATYYRTPLMQVVRGALPPGLLARSQRRVRLVEGDRAGGATPTATPWEAGSAAHHLLTLLQTSKQHDYSWQYLQRQVKDAHRGLQELLKAGWVESYLESPQPVRPKQRQAVTLIATQPPADLTLRQQEILAVLQRQGGELWLTDALQQCRTTSPTLKTLAAKGYLVIQPREVLRSEMAPAAAADAPKTLTSEQAQAVAAIQELDGFAQVLLHGVTGSGKTEVYLQAIAPLLEQGKSALVLVPEIGLTPQLTDRFQARFGDRVCVYHSALSDGERYDTWRQMLAGTAQVVIGTRSAIFAPLPNLGLIVLDEEHDPSFKQDQPAPCYHARTVAQWRASLEHCPIVLGSATPSLETWVQIRGEADPVGDGENQKAIQEIAASSESKSCSDSPRPTPTLYLSLPNRINARPLPPIEVVDMRQELRKGNGSIFSGTLRSALETLREKGQQGILFIHRRGHSTFMSCRSCGYVVTCPNCDVSLSYHQTHADANPLLRCHYCNVIQSVPKTCPACDSTYFKHFGSGTQRVAQELDRLLPDLRVLRFDSDTTRAKGAHRALLTQFAQGEADVLVGTQMLTKGIDLPQVTLVGIVAADGLLHFADYRASERTFQTLTQVAGRCGRGDDPGRVILQTYTPDHAVIQAVQGHAYSEFLELELSQRAALQYPPCGRLILFRFSGLNPGTVQTTADRIATLLQPLEDQGIQILGPAPAAIVRVARRYRWHLLLKLPPGNSAAIPSLEELRALCPGGVSVAIDVDPLNVS